MDAIFRAPFQSREEEQDEEEEDEQEQQQQRVSEERHIVEEEKEEQGMQEEEQQVQGNDAAAADPQPHEGGRESHDRGELVREDDPQSVAGNHVSMCWREVKEGRRGDEGGEVPHSPAVLITNRKTAKVELQQALARGVSGLSGQAAGPAEVSGADDTSMRDDNGDGQVLWQEGKEEEEEEDQEEEKEEEEGLMRVNVWGGKADARSLADSVSLQAQDNTKMDWDVARYLYSRDS